MHNPYKFLTLALLLQWASLVLIGCGYFLFSFRLFLIKRTRKQQQRELKKLLEIVLRKEAKFNLKQLPKKYIKVACLLPVMEELKKQQPGSYWPVIESILLDDFLLPQARMLTNKVKFTERLLAVRVFLLDTKPRDEAHILRLLKDTIPLVRHEAILCAVRLGSKLLVNQLIDSMAGEARFAKYVYKDALREASEGVFSNIKERLLTEKNDKKRIVCMQLLAFKEDDAIVNYIGHDKYSPDMEVRIAVAKVLGFCSQPASVQMLTDLLKDKYWEVRAAAAKALGQLKAEQAILDLTQSLKDSRWWVRMHSAAALLNLGNEGLAVLKSQDPQRDRFAYEMAQYVIKHGEIKGVGVAS